MGRSSIKVRATRHQAINNMAPLLPKMETSTRNITGSLQFVKFNYTVWGKAHLPSIGGF